MMRSAVWLGLCLGLTSTASAESAVPQVRFSVPGVIPSGGVLPILGECYDSSCSMLRSIVVTDATSDARVEGVVELAVRAKDAPGYAYFVPNVPFAAGGRYLVSVPGYSYYSRELFEVGEAPSGAFGPGAVRVASWLEPQEITSGLECCPANDGNCLATEVTTVAQLHARLEVEQSIATQYVYELSARAEEDASSGTILAPFGLLTLDGRSFFHSFDGASKSYCYAVRARPITGGEPFELTTGCRTNGFFGYGKEVRTPEEVAQYLANCKEPPPDAGAPTLGSVDAAVDGDGEELGRGDDRRGVREDSGCRLARGEPEAGLAWCLTMLAALLRRRRAT